MSKIQELDSWSGSGEGALLGCRLNYFLDHYMSERGLEGSLGYLF
jgi:hypothetical protein